jgi:hypothetical protein
MLRQTHDRRGDVARVLPVELAVYAGLSHHLRRELRRRRDIPEPVEPDEAQTVWQRAGHPNVDGRARAAAEDQRLHHAQAELVEPERDGQPAARILRGRAAVDHRGEIVAGAHAATSSAPTIRYRTSI